MRVVLWDKYVGGPLLCLMTTMKFISVHTKGLRDGILHGAKLDGGIAARGSCLQDNYTMCERIEICLGRMWRYSAHCLTLASAVEYAPFSSPHYSGVIVG